MTIVWAELPAYDDFLSTRFVSFISSFLLVIIVSLLTHKNERNAPIY